MRVAIVQSAPVYYDLGASLEKAATRIRDAASQGARLVAFGETWLPGYPTWLDFCPGAALWNHAPTKEVFAQLRANSVVVPSDATAALSSLARECGVVLVIGINEKSDGTLYNTLLSFGSEGAILRHHRKLVPTYTERLVWGMGDGSGLDASSTPYGRVGGLICWEHWMPLARQALHQSGETIHVAAWPTVHEMHQIASRHYAFEGRCFVLAAGLLSTVRDLPSELSIPAELANEPDRLLQRGGSAIIAPDGSYVAGPVFDEETILVGDLDLEMIDRERMTLDVAGHYSRPDVFELRVKTKRD